MNRIAKIRQHVANNRTYYAFVTGSVVTSAVVYWSTKDRTLLELKNAHLELLKQGGYVAYELKDQSLVLVNTDVLKNVTTA